MSNAELEKLIQAGDEKGCLAFFRGMPEKERRTYASQAWKAEREEGKLVASPDGRSFKARLGYGGARICAFATATLAELKKRPTFAEEDVIVDILRDRKLDDLDEWAVWFCEEFPRWGWGVTRRLIRGGLCKKPKSDAYALGIIHGLTHRNWDRPIDDALKAEPDLLSDEVWRLFEVEGNGEVTLAARDKYSKRDNDWASGLLRLCKDGKLPRQRLLDASLDTLRRDFKQFHAGWFSRFHEALEPTIVEREARKEAYLALLSSKIPPTVSFAMDAVKLLRESGKLDGKKTLEALRLVLWSKTKAAVLDALKLLEGIVEETPALRDPASLLVVEALCHESADVQKAALTWIKKRACPPGASLRSLLDDKGTHVAASLKPLLKSILDGAGALTAKASPPPPPAKGDAAAERKLLQRVSQVGEPWTRLAGMDSARSFLEGGAAELRAAPFRTWDVPRLDPERRVLPLKDLDELVDAFARVLEEPGETIEIERVLDGVSRLCDQRPEDFDARTGPLLKRVTQKGKPGGGYVLYSLCSLAQAWISRSKNEPAADGPDSKYSHIQEALHCRVLEIARRAAAGRAAPLLSAPTHAGFWIDPCELVSRSLQDKEKHATLDQIFALLRLAPDRRAEALRSAKSMPGEWGEALRYALGGPAPKQAGPSAGIWIAAARCRAPGDDDVLMEARHSGLGPDAGQRGVPTYWISSRTSGKYTFYDTHVDVKPPRPAKVAAELLTVLMHPPRHEMRYDQEPGTDPAEIRWALSVWPAHPEGRFARGANRIGDNIDWWEAQWGNKTYLEPLLDPDQALTDMSLVLLAFALGAKDPGESGLATDVLITAVDDGRADSGNLGSVFAYLLPTGRIKAARWAKTLGQAARISALHNHTVACLIQRALRGDPAAAPRDVSALLELLREVLAEGASGISDAEARAWLEKLSAGGKTGKLVRELLELPPAVSDQQRHSAALRALENRLERADRWCRTIKAGVQASER